MLSGESVAVQICFSIHLCADRKQMGSCACTRHVHRSRPLIVAASNAAPRILTDFTPFEG
eukprot:3158772-Pleurochrysis_carterae.AAC.1